MKPVIVIQARLKSKRLAKKILMQINGETILSHIVKRCNASKLQKGVTVAVPESDDVEIFNYTGICCDTGPERDLLTRIMKAGKRTNATHVVRVTGDCPLVDPWMIDFLINTAETTHSDVVMNWAHRGYPDGADLEVFKMSFLDDIDRILTKEIDREYFAQWVLEKADTRHIYSIQNVKDDSKYRLTLDWPEDLEVIRRIYSAQGSDLWAMHEVIQFLDTHPEIMKINAKRIDGKFGARPK